MNTRFSFCLSFQAICTEQGVEPCSFLLCRQRFYLYRFRFDGRRGNVIASYKGIDIPVTVETEAPVGDFNGDNSVDIVDFVRMKKILANAAVSDGADADITGDGKVQAVDVTIFKQHILGIISVL